MKHYTLFTSPSDGLICLKIIEISPIVKQKNPQNPTISFITDYPPYRQDKSLKSITPPLSLAILCKNASICSHEALVTTGWKSQAQHSDRTCLIMTITPKKIPAQYKSRNFV